MAVIGETWTYADDPGGRIMVAERRCALQREGHASAIGNTRGLDGKLTVYIRVLPGRPKGWADLYGDEDDDLAPAERAHFGLDRP